MKIAELRERYARQLLLPEIGEEGQERLAGAAVAVVGNGALGSFIAESLARAGVGQLKLIDRDYVELSNLQSQLLFDEGDVSSRYPKAVAVADHLRGINSAIAVEPLAIDLNPWNIERTLKDCELIMDCTDNFETRFLINDFALKHRTPWIYTAVVGTTGMTMRIIPEETACLRCLLPAPPPRSALPTCETAGLLAAAAHFVSSLAVAEALKMLLGTAPSGGSSRTASTMIMADPWRAELAGVAVRRDPDCPACAKKKFDFLKREDRGAPVKICGRDIFQVSPPRPVQLSLAQLARRLERVGPVHLYEYLLQVELPEGELTVFGDGRALIKGARDEAEAKSLYVRYVGG